MMHFYSLTGERRDLLNDFDICLPGLASETMLHFCASAMWC
jgi:hypothetical protein